VKLTRAKELTNRRIDESSLLIPRGSLMGWRRESIGFQGKFKKKYKIEYIKF
jgi:hypothetical protein